MDLKEAKYPVDARGRPDLRYYTDSLEYYVQMYEQHLGTLQGKKGVGYEIERAFSRRVHGMWGLISKGAAAAPFALSLLGRSVPEAREDGAAILAELGRDEVVVDTLLERLKSETDATAKDSMILALGRLKNKKAIPSLATIIRDAATDGDTKWTAVESLGLIVRKRFLKQENPVQSAMAWLASHPEYAG
ncbi:MAG TPA: HEAT repeat domain-containing protein [Gemmataceae bacterium]|nr:HEAT repeat domain-containing protein [Gemmataceae bacterium]